MGVASLVLEYGSVRLGVRRDDASRIREVLADQEVDEVVTDTRTPAPLEEAADGTGPQLDASHVIEILAEDSRPRHKRCEQEQQQH